MSWFGCYTLLLLTCINVCWLGSCSQRLSRLFWLQFLLSDLREIGYLGHHLRWPDQPSSNWSEGSRDHGQGQKYVLGGHLIQIGKLFTITQDRIERSIGELEDIKHNEYHEIENCQKSQWNPEVCIMQVWNDMKSKLSTLLQLNYITRNMKNHFSTNCSRKMPLTFNSSSQLFIKQLSVNVSLSSWLITFELHGFTWMWSSSPPL